MLARGARLSRRDLRLEEDALGRGLSKSCKKWVSHFWRRIAHSKIDGQRLVSWGWAQE